MAASVPGPASHGQDTGILVVAVAIVVLLFIGGALTVIYRPTPTVHPFLPGNPVNVTLNISSTVSSVTPPDFWGVNVRADIAPGGRLPAEVAATPVQMVRWPGGGLTDRYNMTAGGGNGLIYNMDGSTQAPAWTTAQFVQWCLSLGCRAIFSVPAEVDNPAAAASYVAYTENTLHFHPAYWEIGNEPALWTHFGIPWSNWTTNQQVSVSPTGYADVVHAYIQAMRQVDPGIRFIGLGGVGTGGGSETAWIRATVEENGPNLSAIAIHVYPAGAGYPGESPASIYATVTGVDSLPVRVPRDLNSTLSACPTCHISLLVDEFNSASGSQLGSFMDGFGNVLYVAVELEQALDLNVSTMDLWALQSEYHGALFNTSGTARPVYTLYSTLLRYLYPGVLPVRTISALPDVYTLATENLTGNPGASLLVVNLNSTFPARVSLNGSSFPLSSPGSLWQWSNGTASPTVQPLPGQGTVTWILPPQSLALWVAPGTMVFSLREGMANHARVLSSSGPGQLHTSEPGPGSPRAAPPPKAVGAQILVSPELKARSTGTGWANAFGPRRTR